MKIRLAIAISVVIVFSIAIRFSFKFDRPKTSPISLRSFEGPSLVNMSGSLLLCESDGEGLKEGDNVTVEFGHLETGKRKKIVFTISSIRQSSLPVDISVHQPDINRGYLGTEDGPFPRVSIVYKAIVKEKSDALRYKGDTWGILSVQKD